MRYSHKIKATVESTCINSDYDTILKARFTFLRYEKHPFSIMAEPLASQILPIPTPSVILKISSFTFPLPPSAVLKVTSAPIFRASSKRDNTISAANILVAPKIKTF